MVRKVLLVAITVTASVVEAAALLTTSLPTAIPLAPQAGGFGAFGVFHDLRWVLVYHDSWLTFAGLLLAAIALRTLLTALAAWAAWPAPGPPSFRGLAARGLGVVLASMVLLLPWALVALAAAETSLSWLLFGEVLPAVVIVAALAHGPFIPGWWRRGPRLAAMGWSLALLLAATAEAVVLAYSPAAAVIPTAAAAGLVNAAIWLRLAGAAVRHPKRYQRWPVSAALVATIVVVLFLSGALAGFSSQSAASGRPGANIARTPGNDLSLLFIGGYDTRFDGQPAPPGSRLTVFSYTGTDAAGRPLPYTSRDTHQSLRRSAELLAEQVAAAQARFQQPVSLVAESEGTLVLRMYLEMMPHPGVNAAVMLSPLVQPARVYYPPASAGSGWGIAAGWGLRGLLAVVRLTSGAPISADEPFLRSIMDNAPLYRNRMLCPVPGVSLLAVVPLDSAITAPPPLQQGIPRADSPGVHGSLRQRADVDDRVIAFLRGAPAQPTGVGWTYALLEGAGAAWHAPPLPLSINPFWRQSDSPDTARGDNGCA